MNWIRNTVTQSKNDFAKVLLYSFSSLMTVLDMQKKKFKMGWLLSHTCQVELNNFMMLQSVWTRIGEKLNRYYFENHLRWQKFGPFGDV